VAGRIDRLADLRDRGERAGRGFVVQHADRLDLLVLVFAELGFDRLRIDALAPIGRDEFRLEAQALRHLLPQRGELAGLDHQHTIAGRERVHQRALPGAGAGGGVDHDRIGGLEDRLNAFKGALGELGELGAAMVDDRRVHRPQHAVGQRRRARNLQEMAPWVARGILGHRRLL
jgi:hypothetical protein